jgi:hypothetical protein
MGIGSTLTRALIKGAIGVAKEVAREEVRARHRSQSAQSFPNAAAALNNRSTISTIGSHRKALRVVGIIEAHLEQTRNEWLPVFRASFGDKPPPPDVLQQNINDSLNSLAAQLKQQGFPYDKDVAFWQAVSDLHLELMLHKAFPEAWQEWNEDFDSTLERAAAEAKQIARHHAAELLQRVMPNGQIPDADVVNELLIPPVQQLFTQVILPHLIDGGLIRNDPLFMARFGSLIPKVVIQDMIEFSQELYKPML